VIDAVVFGTSRADQRRHPRLPGVRGRAGATAAGIGGVKALLDQNPSYRLVDGFSDRFPGSGHGRDHGLTGDDDERVRSLAKDAGFFIVTKDGDFLARALVRGHPPQVVQVCLGNASTRQIAEAITAHLDDIKQFVAESRESVFLLRG
jgi:predicted nuclease of predicted toxin-antitoxin system